MKWEIPKLIDLAAQNTADGVNCSTGTGADANCLSGGLAAGTLCDVGSSAQF